MPSRSSRERDWTILGAERGLRRRTHREDQPAADKVDPRRRPIARGYTGSGGTNKRRIIRSCNESAASLWAHPERREQMDAPLTTPWSLTLIIALARRFDVSQLSWSHAIDDVDPDIPSQNPNFPGATEVANAIFDRRHRPERGIHRRQGR